MEYFMSISLRVIYNLLEASRDDDGTLQSPSSSNVEDVADFDDLVADNWSNVIS